jgi:hypothetical protein
MNAKALSVMRYQGDINTKHNMKSVCRAAVSQWRKRLTRNGQTRVRNWKGANIHLSQLPLQIAIAFSLLTTNLALTTASASAMLGRCRKRSRTQKRRTCNAGDAQSSFRPHHSPRCPPEAPGHSRLDRAGRLKWAR